ncbi:dehalogenase [Dehalococcoides mccartyi]|jgi:hypothetical protein|uniref:hypothetical protein n=1 Tax=Dehalococcoides TaxID=61434 RepID=UPI0004E07BE6|nr:MULTISPECIES: hypothetical protein [Dehalococcoides]AII58517.1 dehalogenase [Dehalococcoides mccartyi CG1]APH13129.1 dehalogenase [Dehalococcoides mccartyi]QYY58758.1 dehalogenase [Dehalococcoides mccartyi]BAQ35321.1 putative reductive dehalogenase membrane anchoring protein [Dehalococcoides sp. UCH007]BAQ35340.1 putative reductive dehalogenase membrane anchoring protein [Dehalococcoides sp. UCH007]
MFYLIGLLIGIVIASVLYTLNRKVSFKWYDWVFSVLIIGLMSVGTQHLLSSLAGFETSAAWFGFALFAGLAVILAVVEWRLLSGRSKTA